MKKGEIMKNTNIKILRRKTNSNMVTKQKFKKILQEILMQNAKKEKNSSLGVF